MSPGFPSGLLAGALLFSAACQGGAGMQGRQAGEGTDVPVVQDHSVRDGIDQDVPGAPSSAQSEPTAAQPNGAVAASPADLDDPRAPALQVVDPAAVMKVSATLDGDALQVSHTGGDVRGQGPALLGLRATVVGPLGYRRVIDLPDDASQQLPLVPSDALADGLYRYMVTARYPVVSGTASGSHPATDTNGRRADAAEVTARQQLPLVHHASGAFQVVDGDIVEAEDEPQAANFVTSQ